MSETLGSQPPQRQTTEDYVQGRSYSSPIQTCIENSYGFETSAISHLDEVDFDTPGARHYRYKEVDFMYRCHKNAKKLLITFHGSLTHHYDKLRKQRTDQLEQALASEYSECSLEEKNGTTTPPIQMSIDNEKPPFLPLFRCYNIDKGMNVLAMADKLFEVYSKQEIKTAWFLSTKKHNVQAIYDEIALSIISRQSTDDVVAFGSSGGGYPALSFACRLNLKVVIAGTQPMVHQYHPYFKEFQDLVKSVDPDDVVVYTPIEEIIRQRGQLPPKATLYCNLTDKQQYLDSSIAFAKFCHMEFTGQLTTHFFIPSQLPPPNKTGHDVKFLDGPDGVMVDYVQILLDF
jgi:hypothetical protein